MLVCVPDSWPLPQYLYSLGSPSDYSQSSIYSKGLLREVSPVTFYETETYVILCPHSLLIFLHSTFFLFTSLSH